MERGVHAHRCIFFPPPTFCNLYILRFCQVPRKNVPRGSFLTSSVLSVLLPQEIPVGEDITSLEAHVKILQTEYRKSRPDLVAVTDLMVRTFQWRRNDIFTDMPVADVLQKYPFLKTPVAVSIVIFEC